MPRGLTSAVIAQMSSSQVRMAHLVELHFDVVQYFTDAPIILTYNTNTYVPSADFLSFSDIQEQNSIDVGSMAITLSGVNVVNIAEALTSTYIDRVVRIYRAIVLQDLTIVADPFILFEGRINSFDVSEDVGANSSHIKWNCASMMSDFDRTAGRRTNDNDQQVYFPGDRGFQFADRALVDIKWGRA